jgi:hypothetical protein
MVGNVRYVVRIDFHRGDKNLTVDRFVVYDPQTYYNTNRWWEATPIADNPRWDKFSAFTGQILSREYSQIERGIVMKLVVAATEEEMAEYKEVLRLNGFYNPAPHNHLFTYSGDYTLDVESDGQIHTLTYTVKDLIVNPQLVDSYIGSQLPPMALDNELYRTYEQIDGVYAKQIRIADLPEEQMKAYLDQLTAAGFIRYAADGGYTKWLNNKRYSFGYQLTAYDAYIHISVRDELPDPTATPTSVIVSEKLIPDNNVHTYKIHYVPEGSEQSCTAVELVTDKGEPKPNMIASNLMTAGAKTWTTSISYLYYYRGRPSTMDWSALPAAYAMRMTCNGKKINLFDNVYWDKYALPSYIEDYDNTIVPPR